MAAGLSKRQIYTRIRSRLGRIQRELEKGGVGSFYTNRQLGADQNKNPNLAFNISFNVGNMSNGETYRFPVLTIHEPVQEGYGHLDFDKGIQRLIQLAKS